MLDLHDVDSPRRASIAIDKITTSRKRWTREHRRPKALTAREALGALQFEAMLVWVAASNLRNGVELTDDDYERLTLAARRIDAIADEVTR